MSRSSCCFAFMIEVMGGKRNITVKHLPKTVVSMVFCFPWVRCLSRSIMVIFSRAAVVLATTRNSTLLCKRPGQVCFGSIVLSIATVPFERSIEPTNKLQIKIRKQYCAIGNTKLRPKQTQNNHKQSTVVQDSKLHVYGQEEKH